MKKFFKVFFNVLLWLLLICACLITLIVFTSDRNDGVAKIFGYMPMTVKTDSMKPEFKANDMIIVKEIDDVYKLKEGDVITFKTNNIEKGKTVYNTHRIVNVINDNNRLSFETKGDNNPINDSEKVSSDKIIGKWTGKKIGGLGKFLTFLQTKKGFFICILLPLILFFLFELYKFIVALIEFKKPAVAEIDEEEIKRKAIEEYLAKQKAEQGGNADAGQNETAVESGDNTASDSSAEDVNNSEEVKTSPEE